MSAGVSASVASLLLLSAAASRGESAVRLGAAEVRRLQTGQLAAAEREDFDTAAALEADIEQARAGRDEAERDLRDRVERGREEVRGEVEGLEGTLKDAVEELAERMEEVKGGVEGFVEGDCSEVSGTRRRGDGARNKHATQSLCVCGGVFFKKARRKNNNKHTTKHTTSPHQLNRLLFFTMTTKTPSSDASRWTSNLKL